MYFLELNPKMRSRLKSKTARTLVCLLFLALNSPHLALAAKIKQYVSGQDQAIVELDSPEEAKAGDLLLATYNGKQCSLEVLKITERIAQVKTSDCPFRTELVIGQVLEKSLMDPEVKVPALEVKAEAPPEKAVEPAKVETSSPIESPQSTRKTYHSFLIGSMFNAKMTFNGTFSDGTVSDSGTLEYTHSSGLVIGYEWSQFNPHHWNHGITVDYASLELDTLTATSGGTSASGKVSGKTETVSLGYSGKYLWEKFYFPVGIGLGSVTHTGSIRYLQSVSGIVTFWLGAGIRVSESFNLEFQSRAIGLIADPVYSGTTSITTESGSFSALTIQGKFLF